MHKFLGTLICCGLLFSTARAQDEPDLRFFFDTRGVGEKEKRPDPDPLGLTNPTVTAGAEDPVRFYLYAEYQEPNQSTGRSFVLSIAVDGDGMFSSWLIYNNFAGGPRWDGMANSAGRNVKRIVRVKAIALINPGLGQYEGDPHYLPPEKDGGSKAGTTLVGFVDVVRRGSESVRVHLEAEGKSYFLGFCDDAVERGPSELWDARVSAGACDPCDVNCDGSVDLTDIEPFIDLLLGGGCACTQCAGDTNGDGSVDLTDVEAFIECLL